MENESDDRVLRLTERWHALASPYHCRATRTGILDPIIRRYCEPHRHYHTLEHIEEMLAIIDEHRERLLEYEVLCFATWFHDVVYDPCAQDNEERSAVLARRTMPKLMVHGWMTLRTVALIHATKTHEPPDRSFDAALFIDADLAVLGAEPERFRRYARDIRREYAHVPDDAYRAGRRGVLERFLARESVYRTDVMRERLEARARRNIHSELATD
jgi:predicted metal-dependent HD superfamily phosphohydrolase